MVWIVFRQSTLEIIFEMAVLASAFIVVVIIFTVANAADDCKSIPGYTDDDIVSIAKDILSTATGDFLRHQRFCYENFVRVYGADDDQGRIRWTAKSAHEVLVACFDQSTIPARRRMFSEGVLKMALLSTGWCGQGGDIEQSILNSTYEASEAMRFGQIDIARRRLAKFIHFALRVLLEEGKNVSEEVKKMLYMDAKASDQRSKAVSSLAASLVDFFHSFEDEWQPLRMMGVCIESIGIIYSDREGPGFLKSLVKMAVSDDDVLTCGDVLTVYCTSGTNGFKGRLFSNDTDEILSSLTKTGTGVDDEKWIENLDYVVANVATGSRIYAVIDYKELSNGTIWKALFVQAIARRIVLLNWAMGDEHAYEILDTQRRVFRDFFIATRQAGGLVIPVPSRFRDDSEHFYIVLSYLLTDSSYAILDERFLSKGDNGRLSILVDKSIADLTTVVFCGPGGRGGGVHSNSVCERPKGGNVQVCKWSLDPLTRRFNINDYINVTGSDLCYAITLAKTDLTVNAILLPSNLQGRYKSLESSSKPRLALDVMNSFGSAKYDLSCQFVSPSDQSKSAPFPCEEPPSPPSSTAGILVTGSLENKDMWSRMLPNWISSSDMVVKVIINESDGTPSVLFPLHFSGNHSTMIISNCYSEQGGGLATVSRARNTSSLKDSSTSCHIWRLCGFSFTINDKNEANLLPLGYACDSYVTIPKASLAFPEIQLRGKPLVSDCANKVSDCDTLDANFTVSVPSGKPRIKVITFPPLPQRWITLKETASSKNTSEWRLTVHAFVVNVTVFAIESRHVARQFIDCSTPTSPSSKPAAKDSDYATVIALSVTVAILGTVLIIVLLAVGIKYFRKGNSDKLWKVKMVPMKVTNASRNTENADADSAVARGAGNDPKDASGDTEANAAVANIYGSSPKNNSVTLTSNGRQPRREIRV